MFSAHDHWVIIVRKMSQEFLNQCDITRFHVFLCHKDKQALSYFKLLWLFAFNSFALLGSIHREMDIFTITTCSETDYRLEGILRWPDRTVQLIFHLQTTNFISLNLYKLSHTLPRDISRTPHTPCLQCIRSSLYDDMQVQDHKWKWISITW